VYLLMGLGVALTLPQLSSAAVQGLAPARFAAGAGTNQALRNIGATLGVAAVVVILAGATPARTLGAFHETSLLTAISGLLVAGIAATLPRRVRTQTAPVAVPDPA
jgi:hypothetical protein